MIPHGLQGGTELMNLVNFINWGERRIQLEYRD